MSGPRRGGSGRRPFRRRLPVLVAASLLLVATGAPGVLAEEASGDPLPSPTPSVTTADPTEEPSPSEDPTPTGDAVPEEDAGPTGDAGPSAEPSPSADASPGAATSTAPVGDATVAVAVETPSGPTATVTTDPAAGETPAPTADASQLPAVPPTTDLAAELSAATDAVAPPGAATAPEEPSGATASVASLGTVEAVIADYVRSVVGSAVVDRDGEVAACFCALAISVSLDGPTNAVAALGRVTGASTDGTTASDARSGRSGDAAALSVTGGGSASSSAVSGDTGAVGPAGPGDLVTATGARNRSTTIDVGAITSALRTLVQDLGTEVGRIAGADTTAQVTDLLAGLPSRTAAAGERADVEVAAWERSAGSAGVSGQSGTGRSLVRCAAYDGSSDLPSCALAVAVTAGSGAQAVVVPPQLPTTESPTGAGAPGMAAAISVAVSGVAVSSARTGDAGTRVPRPAVLADASTGLYEPSLSESSARSGGSGRSTAVALTVRGASATAARSGDTGSATSTVLAAAAGTPLSSTSAAPGAGGTATAAAGTGDSGDAVALSSGATGAASESRSGDTGDAVATAADGGPGLDWSAGSGGGGGQVVGGAGGDAGATAATGGTGDSLSLVISGGSAAATATSGDTGDSIATASGGTGGDTHLAGSGNGTVRSGDGGAGQADGTSGRTGTSVAILVTPYDATGASRSGSSGTVTSRARGGDAGCASSGVDPNQACASPTPSPPPDAPASSPGDPLTFSGAGPTGQVSLNQDGRWHDGAGRGALTAGSPAPAATRSAPGGSGPSDDSNRSGAGSTRNGPVARADARSADSAAVECWAAAGIRRCRSADTAPARASARSAGQHVAQPGDLTREPAAPVANVAAASGRAAAPDRDEGGAGTIALLFNAAVPLLAVLSLVAMVAVSRARRSPRAPAYVPRHRRKQDLPRPAATRSR